MGLTGVTCWTLYLFYWIIWFDFIPEMWFFFLPYPNFFKFNLEKNHEYMTIYINGASYYNGYFNFIYENSTVTWYQNINQGADSNGDLHQFNKLNLTYYYSALR